MVMQGQSLNMQGMVEEEKLLDRISSKTFPKGAMMGEEGGPPDLIAPAEDLAQAFEKAGYRIKNVPKADLTKAMRPYAELVSDEGSKLNTLLTHFMHATTVRNDGTIEGEGRLLVKYPADALMRFFGGRGKDATHSLDFSVYSRFPMHAFFRMINDLNQFIAGVGCSVQTGHHPGKQSWSYLKDLVAHHKSGVAKPRGAVASFIPKKMRDILGFFVERLQRMSSTDTDTKYNTPHHFNGGFMGLQRNNRSLENLKKDSRHYQRLIMPQTVSEVVNKLEGLVETRSLFKKLEEKPYEYRDEDGEKYGMKVDPFEQRMDEIENEIENLKEILDEERQKAKPAVRAEIDRIKTKMDNAVNTWKEGVNEYHKIKKEKEEAEAKGEEWKPLIETSVPMEAIDQEKLLINYSVDMQTCLEEISALGINEDADQLFSDGPLRSVERLRMQVENYQDRGDLPALEDHLNKFHGGLDQVVKFLEKQAKQFMFQGEEGQQFTLKDHNIYADTIREIREFQKQIVIGVSGLRRGIGSKDSIIKNIKDLQLRVERGVPSIHLDTIADAFTSTMLKFYFQSVITHENFPKEEFLSPIQRETIVSDFLYKTGAEGWGWFLGFHAFQKGARMTIYPDGTVKRGITLEHLLLSYFNALPKLHENDQNRPKYDDTVGLHWMRTTPIKSADGYTEQALEAAQKQSYRRYMVNCFGVDFIKLDKFHEALDKIGIAISSGAVKPDFVQNEFRAVIEGESNEGIVYSDEQKAVREQIFEVKKFIIDRLDKIEKAEQNDGKLRKDETVTAGLRGYTIVDPGMGPRLMHKIEYETAMDVLTAGIVEGRASKNGMGIGIDDLRTLDIASGLNVFLDMAMMNPDDILYDARKAGFPEMIAIVISMYGLQRGARMHDGTGEFVDWREMLRVKDEPGMQNRLKEIGNHIAFDTAYHSNQPGKDPNPDVLCDHKIRVLSEKIFRESLDVRDDNWFMKHFRRAHKALYRKCLVQDPEGAPGDMILDSEKLAEYTYELKKMFIFDGFSKEWMVDLEQEGGGDAGLQHVRNEVYGMVAKTNPHYLNESDSFTRERHDPSAVHSNLADAMTMSIMLEEREETLQYIEEMVNDKSGHEAKIALMELALLNELKRQELIADYGIDAVNQIPDLPQPTNGTFSWRASFKYLRYEFDRDQTEFKELLGEDDLEEDVLDDLGLDLAA